jgi:FKBP-type peptidyl-prolyl cis-trans isomerase
MSTSRRRLLAALIVTIACDDDDLLYLEYLESRKERLREAATNHEPEIEQVFATPPRELVINSSRAVSSDITMEASKKKRSSKEDGGSTKRSKTAVGLEANPADATSEDLTAEATPVKKSIAAPNTVLGKIVSAIRALGKGSSSRSAIAKYIKEVYGYDNANAIKKAFQTGTSNGTLTQTGQSFRVTEDPEVQDARPGLQIEDVSIQKGPKAASGDTVTMKYVGTLDHGYKFDESSKFTFCLGAGEGKYHALF